MVDKYNPEYVKKTNTKGISSLRYPLDISSEKESHWIQFSIYSRGTLETPNKGRSTEDLEFDINKPQIDYTVQKNTLATNGYYNKSGNLIGSITLYIPNELSTSYSFDYSDNDLGGIGNLAYLLAIGDKYGAKEVATHELLIGGVDKAAGTGGRFEKSIGQVINPYMEVFFKSPTFRTHSFEFKFNPTNEKETNQVQNIIYMFKYCAHPGLLNNHSRALFKYPEEFEINFFSNNEKNKYLFRIGRSYLTSIDVNYNAAGFTSFFKNTNAPTNISLKMIFKETTILTKEDIREGF